jgi:hypothetical protein
MAQRKPPQPPKKAEVSIVRSSAAEYLTFIAASGQGGVEAVYADESIWLTQKDDGHCSTTWKPAPSTTT